jgi:hypothetical protein
MKYFGDPKFRKGYEEQVATPVGVLCLHCDEPIQEDDTGTMEVVLHSNLDTSLKPLHYECRLRQAVGSVGHQKGLCSCYGGTEEDPPGMTRHEAAIAATRYFHCHD